jgi:hypothetical protein
MYVTVVPPMARMGIVGSSNNGVFVSSSPPGRSIRLMLASASDCSNTS